MKNRTILCRINMVLLAVVMVAAVVKIADARYYDAALGRFLSADPVEGPNRYAYVRNNPVNMVDPTGLVAKPTRECTASGCYSYTPGAWGSPENRSHSSWSSRIISGISWFVNAATNHFIKNTSTPPIELLTDPNDPVGNILGILPETGMVSKAGKIARLKNLAKDLDLEKIPEYLYRGINSGHPKYPEALKGIAEPTDPANKLMTAEEHSSSYEVARTASRFTSWTSDPNRAAHFAMWPFNYNKLEGREFLDTFGKGVVLEIPFRNPPSNSLWSFKRSILSRSHEKEVLVEGTLTGAAVRHPSEVVSKEAYDSLVDLMEFKKSLEMK